MICDVIEIVLGLNNLLRRRLVRGEDTFAIYADYIALADLDTVRRPIWMPAFDRHRER